MNFNTNKEKGNAGVALAIGYYGSNGYTVSIPLNDTQDYDLIVEKDNKLQRVQVKATSQRSEYGYSLVSVRGCGGTKGSTYKTVKDTVIEILFVVTEEMEMYEIPVTEITSGSQMGLGPDRQKYRVDNIPTEYNGYQKKEKKSNPRTKDYFCSKCNKEISKNKTGLCINCYNQQQIEDSNRPNKLTLAKEIVENGFEAVGRYYGVSGNAIKKWCKAYEIPHLKKELEIWYNQNKA